MIEFRGSMAGIGDSTASPQINPITPKMDASFIHKIFNTKFGIVSGAYNEFSDNIVVSGSNAYLTIDSGMIICYGYRCVNSQPIQFNLQLTPYSMYYHIVFKVDLTGSTAKFSIYCTDAVSTVSLNNLHKDDLSVTDGIFEMHYGIVSVSASSASFSTMDAWDNIDCTYESRYVNNIEFINGANILTIKEKDSSDTQIIEKKIKIFDPSIHQSKVYAKLGYGILAKNFSSAFLTDITASDVNYLQLSESLAVGDIIEIHFNDNIQRYKISGTLDVNGFDIYQFGFRYDIPGLTIVVMRVTVSGSKLVANTSGMTANMYLNDLSSEDTYVVQNDSTDSTTINGITAIYKILGGV